ncbi:MAG: tRNA (guanosine(46)-N7)-methyltransferase TrmB, partial [Enterobacteriaceae bacterium]
MTHLITSGNDTTDNHFRQIRSFVRRQGRMTARQQMALEQLWPIMGVEFSHTLLDFTQLFQREADTVLEIGFGMGASLVETAAAWPQHNFIGIEVHTPGVGACLAAAREAKLTNLRVICHDAVEVFHYMIAPASLDRVQLFFPDPWHKARHHKRRIVQPAFTGMVRKSLKLGGVLHMATDWQNYAEHMLEVMSHSPGYRNLSPDGSYVPRPPSRPLTKFELRGQRLGHGVWDLMFDRVTEGEDHG